VVPGIDKKDRHFPLFVNDNPIRRLFGSPQKYCSYVQKGQIVADLGCGPGFYSFALADCVGAKGRVYAIDSDENSIRAVKSKATKNRYNNLVAHASTAADLSFIEPESVDFVLADGVLCCMAPKGHQSAIGEIKRIMKPTGKAFLKVVKGSMSYVDEAEWEKILEGFKVERRSNGSFLKGRWALVSKLRDT
jgi:ubiquinone/menaquinone biosynthesis C-methylase UbiE